MQFPDSFFEDEVRSGFYVPALMKRCWAGQIEVLAEVARICAKYNLPWFAASGTLLGAVRHGGYIPWDDDLDICMLRKDYVIFNKVAEKEFPKGFHIHKDRADNCRFVTPVFGGKTFDAGKEHLERFHDFPFAPGIDIFPLDCIPPDPSDEAFQNHLITIVLGAATTINVDNQNTDESETMVSKIEELLKVRLDRDLSLKDQLFALLENIYALYTDDDKAKELTIMAYKYFDPRLRFPIECYQDSLLLPFETVKIPVPVSYEKVLKAEYGDYQKPIRGGGDHEYPYFHSVEQKAIEQGAGFCLKKYCFSHRDLEKKRIDETPPQKLAEKFVLQTDKIHQTIDQLLQGNELPTVRKLLESCQNAAICMGTMIEQIEGGNFSTVKLLEQYCELLYQIHEELGTDFSPIPKEMKMLICQKLKTMHTSLANSVQNDFARRKEIVFLPYKVSLWGPMEPIWRKAMENPDFHVSVIPIPYFYRDFAGHASNMQYEGKRFPDYVPITNYEDYDFKSRQPDRIFIHNPYDEYNLAATVHPFFYASNLKQYTNHLIYMPCFPLEEISRDDRKSWYNMRYYVAMPGVVQADWVAVPSPQTRQLYIDYLTEFAGKDTRSVWENKVTVLDDSILLR